MSCSLGRPAVLSVLFFSLAACGGATRTPGDSVATAGTVGAGPMSAMMMDSAMVMLHGFCAVENDDRPAAGAAERRIELIVGGDATRRTTSITVSADSTAAAALTAELTAGSDAHAMCAGPGRSIIIGGTAMFLGAVSLKITTAGPVTVLARTVNAQTLAGPVQLRPGQRGVVLAWGGEKR